MVQRSNGIAVQRLSIRNSKIKNTPTPQHFQMYTYFLLNICSIAFPLAFSFDKRLNFYKNWKGLFWGIGIMGAIYIVWDMAFTAMGVWGFNEKYLTGWQLANLPLEEWMFFFFIPYSCLFIYEAANYFIKTDYLGKIARPLALALGAVILVIGMGNIDKWYTGMTFIFCGGYLLLHNIVFRPVWLGRFFVGYFFSLIPFLLVNGWLTGGFTAEPVVWYDDTENLGIRIGTIPVEDSVYLLLLLLGITTIYEWVNHRR